MKITSLLSSAVLTVLAIVPLESKAEKPVTRKGTAVMHYMTRNDLHNTNDPATVVGSLRLQSNEQGRSSKQMLDLRLHGLATNESYQLTALMGDDPNVLVVATDLVPNRRGHVRVAYKSNGQGGGGRHPLPESLSPLTDLRALGLDQGATQNVAHAWIADASKFQYIVKRNLTAEDTNGTAAGSISLIANHHRTKLRLLAGGLSATNDYHLALNGEIRHTVQTSETGRLEINEWPAEAPAVLDLRSLALWDASSNVVLRTTLPK
jgi:hypothetical protein